MEKIDAATPTDLDKNPREQRQEGLDAPNRDKLESDDATLYPDEKGKSPKLGDDGVALLSLDD